MSLPWGTDSASSAGETCFNNKYALILFRAGPFVNDPGKSSFIYYNTTKYTQFRKGTRPVIVKKAVLSYNEERNYCCRVAAKGRIPMLVLADIREAQQRIAPFIIRTPLLRQPALDPILGCEVYLKHEGLQITGSFKLRGATNKIVTLTEEQLKNGVVAASSGNHAMGVAYAARQQGAKAVIVMPTNANPVKIAGVRELGGTVLLEGTLSSEREAKVRSLVEEEGMAEVHPFGDPLVAAGQGTIGLEIMADLADVDTIIVPIGGGGLISGVATAVKGIRPDVHLIGVEPAGAPRYTLSRAAKKPVKLDAVHTIADGTRTDCANPSNFVMIENLVDRLITVEDNWIEEGMKLAAAKAKLIVEPSSVMGLAAALSRKITFKEGQKVCFILSGGNNDLAQLARILVK